MPWLTDRDLRGVLDLAADCAEVRTGDDVGAVLLPQLARRLGAEVAVHTQTHLRNPQDVLNGWPRDAVDLPWARAYQPVMTEHPFVGLGRRGRLPEVVRISDLLTSRQWRASRLYLESHRHLGAADQMTLVLSQAEDVVHGVSLSSPGRPFTDRQRDLLLLCRPHVTAALRRVFASASPYRAIRLFPEPAWVDFSGEAVSGQECGGARLLTEAEQRVMDLVSQGLTSGQVARRLGVSPRTVSKHLERVHVKLQVTNRVAAVMAYQAALLETPLSG